MTQYKEILFQVNTIDYQSDFIEIYVQNVFRPPFLLQFTFNQHQAIFFRTSFFKSNDFELVCVEKGKLSLKYIQNIIHQFNHLTLSTFLDCSLAGRDGNFYELTKGDKFSRFTYSWYEVFVPDAWEELNKIADDLMNLQQYFEIENKEYFKFQYQEEQNENAFSTFFQITNFKSENL